MPPNCMHAEGAYHDCEYVDARNELIPLAEHTADLIAGQMPEGDDQAYWTWSALWNARYAQAMAQLIKVGRMGADAVAVGTGRREQRQKRYSDLGD